MDTNLRVRFVWCSGAAVGAGWPLATLAGMNQFASVFGLVGVLRALPASVALLLDLRHLRAQYPASDRCKF